MEHYCCIERRTKGILESCKRQSSRVIRSFLSPSPSEEPSFRALTFLRRKLGAKISTRGAEWMNEFPPRGLGCLSFPAKWHGTRFVSGELDRIEIPLYTHIYIYTGRVSLALINSLQVRERGRGGCIMFRNGVQRVKFLPLRSPRRYVENFNGINTLQVLRKEERRLPGNIQRKGKVG